MIIAVLVLLGLCFGSFVNALVWRVHQQASSKKRRTDPKLSITHGRSMCVHCGHVLSLKDLIPVISWVSLGGRCRYCHKSISLQYPLVELVTVGLFILSYICWPYSWDMLGWLQFGLWLTSLVLMVTLAIYDAKWMLLPDRVVFPGVVTSVLFSILTILSNEHPIHRLVLIIGSLLIASGLFWVLFVVSNGTWIGGGDVKLGIMLGLLLGTPFLAMLMLFLASILGTLWALPQLVRGQNLKIKLPFGPFLIVATYVVFLYGQQVVNWYSQTFMP